MLFFYLGHKGQGTERLNKLALYKVVSELQACILRYRMPSADFHAQFIMRCGFHNQIEGELLSDCNREEPPESAEVIIINPDRWAALHIEAIVGGAKYRMLLSSTLANYGKITIIRCSQRDVEARRMGWLK